MKTNLGNFPKCCLHQGRQDQREIYRCKTLAHIEMMKAELREMQKHFIENPEAYYLEHKNFFAEILGE